MEPNQSHRVGENWKVFGFVLEVLPMLQADTDEDGRSWGASFRLLRNLRIWKTGNLQEEDRTSKSHTPISILPTVNFPDR